MTFSLAGSIITQANESGIAITAAASITGGVRFTCTQAYAAGNLIRITGTTNYNGEWIVDAATGTTFDVKWSAKGDALDFVSSQTGTAARGDSSLAAMAGIAGVTTRAINQGYLVTRTTYVLPSMRLVVTGSLRINPGIEQIEHGTTAPLNELLVNSGGVLSVVERYGATYGIREWHRVTRIRNTNGTEHWTPEGASIIINSGGTFNWAGGSIAATSVWSYGTTTIDYGVVNGQPFLWVVGGNVTVNSSYLVDAGGTLTINAISLGTMCQFYSRPGGASRTYSNLTGTPGFMEGEGNVSFGGTLTGTYTLLNLPDGVLGFQVVSTRQSRMTIVNSVQGSSTTQSLGFTDPTPNFPNGRIEFRKRVTFQYRTPALAAIQNVHVFMRDTNNGLRSNRTNDNYVNDRTYLSTSNASGLTSQFEVMTATVRPTSSSNATLIYDRRSVSNDSNDVFRVGSHAYTHLLSDLSIPMRGTGDLTQGVTMFADAAVTLSQASAAALATVATLDNFYDAAKDWKCQANSARLEYPTLFTQPVNAAGTTIDCGALNIVVDATAAAAFAINTGTNTITVKSTTLAAGTKFSTLKTTGTISFANGAAATCFLQGIVVRGTTGAYSPKLESATVRFTAAGTYDLRGATIGGTLTVTNTSGGAVTVQVQPSVTVVNSGPNITVDNSPPPTFQSVTVTNGVAGTRLLIQDITTPASPVTLYSGIPASFPHTWTDPVAYAANRDIRVRAAYQSGTSAKMFVDEEIGTVTLASPALSYRLNQVDDAVYQANAINGSAVSGITIDDPTLLINVSASTISLQSIYAYEVYWLSTAAGIVDEGRIVTAPDTANYIFEGGWKIKNISSPSVALTITGGYMVDATTGTAISLIDTTGGTIFLAPDHVVPYATGSGVTPGDKTDIAAAVLAAAQATPIHADAKLMNGAAIQGNGSAGNLWRGV